MWQQLFLCLLAFAFSSSAFAEINHPEKIGIGTWEFGGNDFALTQTEEMNFKWYYTWRTTQLWSSSNIARTVPFVPMIWDESNVNEVAPRESGVLLGFNEPDHPDQANMSVSQAIQLWPRLMESGLRLGSPAMAGDARSSSSWLGQFMGKANALGYRVDFIAIHYYSSTGDVNEFKAYLESIYNTYKKPIWVTEWAQVDWSNPGRYSYEQNAAFARQALEMLDDLPFVERHAWFSMPSYPHFGGPQTSLFDKNLNLTSVGQVFQQVLSGASSTPDPAPTPDPTPAPTPDPAPTPAPNPSTNLLQNPSFDSNLTSWDNWGNSVVDSGKARTGTSAGGIAQDVIDKLVAGKTYRLQASGALGISSEVGWIGIKISNGSGGTLLEKNVQVVSTSYQNYTFDFKMPAGAASAIVYSWKDAGAGSHLYVDDFSLVDLSQTTTPSPTPAPAPIGDEVAPSVSLLSASSGAIVPRRSSVTLTATASDNVGVTKVIFYVNGSQVCSLTAAPYSCKWRTPKKPGGSTIEVKAQDAAGNVGSSGVITVQVK